MAARHRTRPRMGADSQLPEETPMSPTHEGDRMPTTEPPNNATEYLSVRQLARIEALRAVNGYVRSTKLMGGEAADPYDLMRLAHFVLYGEDLIDSEKNMEREFQEVSKDKTLSGKDLHFEDKDGEETR